METERSIGSVLNSVAREFHRVMDGNLKKQGLSAAQIHLLGFLDWQDSMGEAVTQNDICRHCSNTRASSVTSLLSGLERSGLIVRNLASDARRKNVVLTEKGRRVAAECHRFVLLVEERIGSCFTEEEAELFLNFLNRTGKVLAEFNH